MLLELSSPSPPLFGERLSAAQADVSRWEIPGGPDPRSKGSGAWGMGKGGAAPAWPRVGGSMLCGLGPAVSPGRAFPEHPAPMPLGPASSWLPSKRVTAERVWDQGQAWVWEQVGGSGPSLLPEPLLPIRRKRQAEVQLS